METVARARSRPRVVRVDGLARDRREIQTAMDMVASGLARQVQLTGLQFGERLLAEATGQAGAFGLRVGLDRSPDGRSTLRISRSEPTPAE